ncbi:hypothetical protein Pure05_40740 [Paenarthrobacter ureafaciens]|nr:hypothetical protein Pure05_40740 [Paenarthrobacter ureafaciens]
MKSHPATGAGRVVHTGGQVEPSAQLKAVPIVLKPFTGSIMQPNWLRFGCQLVAI